MRNHRCFGPFNNEREICKFNDSRTRNGHQQKKMKLKWVKLNFLPLKSNEQTKISQTVNYLNLIIKPFNNDNNNNIKMSRAVFFMTINENVSTVWAALYEITLYYFLRQVWVMSVSLLFALPFIFSLCLTRICVMAIFFQLSSISFMRFFFNVSGSC